MKQQYSVKITPRGLSLGVKLYYVILNIEAGGHRIATPRGAAGRRTISVHTAKGAGVVGIRTSVPPKHSSIRVIIFVSNLTISIFINHVIYPLIEVEDELLSIQQLPCYADCYSIQFQNLMWNTLM